MLHRNLMVAVGLTVVLAACDTPQSAAPTKVVLPEPGSVGAEIMTSFCSDCHAPPSPATHVAEEWPNVIYRMQERRRMEAYNMMSKEEEAALLAYLQKHSKETI